MADSNITRKALADSMKELMEREDFSKISVADICNGCGMNRKSFYYHFKDKYDLVNWIFDIEFLSVMNPREQSDSWKMMEALCFYFYENRKFYANALQIKGQNSFEEHFVELVEPFIEEPILHIISTEGDNSRFYVDFCMDAFLGAIKRWITDKECMKPKEFLKCLENCIHIIAAREQKLLLEDE